VDVIFVGFLAWGTRKSFKKWGKIGENQGKIRENRNSRPGECGKELGKIGNEKRK
jgi:hypothetical protein